MKCQHEEVSRLRVASALITFPKNDLLSVFSPSRSKAILAYYEQVMIKFRSFYKLEKLLRWFYFCLSIDLSLPRNQVNSVEHLHAKLGIRTPVLNRLIAEQAKDILLFCSTNVSQTDGFPSFISLQCRCHSTACAWAAAGQQLSRTCTCFQNPVWLKAGVYLLGKKSLAGSVSLMWHVVVTGYAAEVMIPATKAS